MSDEDFEEGRVSGRLDTLGHIAAAVAEACIDGNALKMRPAQEARTAARRFAERLEVELSKKLKELGWER